MESATRTIAIVFAHTIVESPKNGAIRRAAAISAPSVEVPTTNTSSSRVGKRPRMRRRVWRGRSPTLSVHEHEHGTEVDLRVLRVHLRPGRGRPGRRHPLRHRLRGHP